MYLLSRKPNSDEGTEMFNTKYQYRERLENGIVRTTPCVSQAEKFTEKQVNDGVPVVFDDWDFVKVSTAKQRKQYRKFK